MWDFPLYAVNVFYYHWLTKNLLWTYGGTKYRKVEVSSRDRGDEKVESGRHHVAAEGDRCQNLPGKP